MAITIKHGVNSMNLDGLAGLTVGDVRERVEGALNLGEEEQARVNGLPASDETVLADGQTVEFVKVAGEKGA